MLITTPDVLLLEKFRKRIFEIKCWLESIILNDPITECQKFALDCLSVVAHRFK